MSEIVKVHFGGTRPGEIESVGTVNGFTEMWLYRDIKVEQDSEGNNDYVAEGVMIRTKLTEDEVLSQKDIYFKSDVPSQIDTIEAQVLYTALMTDTLLEG